MQFVCVLSPHFPQLDLTGLFELFHRAIGYHRDAGWKGRTRNAVPAKLGPMKERRRRAVEEAARRLSS